MKSLVTIAVLPGVEGGVAATIASAQRQGVPVNVIVVPSSDRVSGEYIAFARAGDRFLPGKLERQVVTLSETGGEASYTAHRRLWSDGRTIGDVQPPPPNELRVPELLLRCPVATSTMLLRREALPPDGLTLLARPGGDVVVWAETVARQTPALVNDVLAEVLLDPERDGLNRDQRLQELSTIANSLVCRQSSAASIVRRELLSLTVLEGAPDAVTPDALGVGAREDGIALERLLRERDAVIDDLIWALARQAERLAAERSGWPTGKVAETERVAEWPDVELTSRDEAIFKLNRGLVDLNEQAMRIHDELVARHQSVAWLHQEVAARDTQINALHRVVAQRDGRVAQLEAALAVGQPKVKRPSRFPVALMRHGSAALRLKLRRLRS